MPNRWTFTIKPINKLLEQELTRGIWVDPFAGRFSPAGLTNDINPQMTATCHKDALEFLQGLNSEMADGVLFDPPYSFRQASECYKMVGRDAAIVTSKKYWAECKKEIARIVKPGGKAICFGWNTMGLGKNRGFEMKRILIVPHGGSMNDTMVTVEIKIVPGKVPPLPLPRYFPIK